VKIVRDGASFSVVGAIQVVLDSTVYIVLTKFGVPTPPANVCGRIAGAALGFWLNGRVTFAHHDQPRFRWRLTRYILLWIAMTIISTAALTIIGHRDGLKQTWWAKPLIETALGLTSFLICRYWVYRR
jgi:putative flippase GtrA